MIERLRLLFRLRPKLPLEGRHADLVLAEGRAPSSRIDVELHQISVHGFLERIDLQRAERGLHRGVDGAAGALMGEQSGKAGQRQLAQPLTVAEQPVLERRFLHRQTVKEVALVQRDRLRERLGRGLRGPPLEIVDVDGHPVRIQGHGVPAHDQGREGGLARLFRSA